MIAVWIVATCFTLVGALYSGPKWLRLLQFGTYANVAIGTVFFLVGLAVFGVGAMLVAHYPELIG